MSQVMGAFGLLDFTMLRPVLAWRFFWNLWTVYFFNFPIFFGPRWTANNWSCGYWISGYGSTSVFSRYELETSQTDYRALRVQGSQNFVIFVGDILTPDFRVGVIFERWAGYITLMEANLVGSLRERDLSEKHRRRWEDNINISLTLFRMASSELIWLRTETIVGLLCTW
jgi:hypothetical protein